MSLEQLQSAAAELSAEKQKQLIGFLLKLRSERDPEYRREMQARLDDSDPTHWLTPEQFEARLKQD